MAGHRRAEATPFSERLCPAMTMRKFNAKTASAHVITLLRRGEVPAPMLLHSTSWHDLSADVADCHTVQAEAITSSSYQTVNLWRPWLTPD